MVSASNHPAVPPPLHELESELMGLVWELGETTVRAALEALNARADKPRAYTTVMTTLARLHTKGLLDRRREQRTDVYTAAMSEEDYRRARAASDIQSLVAEYGDVALVGFAREMNQLDPGRRERLRRLARRDEG
jgi:predicted transcriptional regulator